MAKVLISDQYLEDIADAIREKKAVSTTYTPSQMANAILSIETNSGTQINLQNKTITPTENQQTISYDNGYTGLGNVTVEPISSTYVGSGISRQNSQTIIPTTSNQIIPANTYLTGAQTINGDSDLIAANIKHGVDIFGVTGTFGVKIETIVAAPSERGQTIRFTGLKAQPLAFSCMLEDQGTFTSVRTVYNVTYDGNKVYNLTSYRSGSSLLIYKYENCTFTYSSGTLTITSPSSGANGVFQAFAHRLLYVYEE